MRRITFLGLGAVAVLALGLTAASVDSGLQTVDPDPSGEESQPRPPSERGPGGSADDTPDGDGSVDSTTANETAGPPTTGQRSLTELLLSIVLLVVGGCAVIYGLTRGEDVSTAPDSDSTPSTADQPAPREHTVRDVAPSNDLFRSWLALKEATHSSRDAVTPAEVKTAAVENGYPRPAVDELTAMFCAVRYGDEELTGNLERRARRLGEQLDSEDR